MKRLHWKITLFFICALISSITDVNAQVNITGEMYDLAKMKSGVRNRRISSYDRSGNNRDHLV